MGDATRAGVTPAQDTDLDAAAAAILQEAKGANCWPYATRDGRMFRQWEGRGGLEEKCIADFTAQLVKIATDEAGAKVFTLQGVGVRSGGFAVDIPATEYTNRGVLAILHAAAPLDPIYPTEEKHLLAAIKRLSTDEPVYMERITRPSWRAGAFVMPGRAADGLDVHLSPRLPFAVDPGADLDIGLAALGALVKSAGDAGAVLLAFMLGAPLAELTDWQDVRYAVFVHGRTGSLKTSHAQLFQAIYGPDFRRDSSLVKWGEGATKNAIMALASAAGDLPFLIDNFKPSLGGGALALVGLIHNILEGGEKDRLNRNSDLKRSRPVSAWPMFTGEDVPDMDAAALARMLLVRFDRAPGLAADDLSAAQDGAKHLNAVGAAWLDWLESDNGQDAAARAADQTDATRAAWLARLAGEDANGNIKRIASNLAVNQLSLQVAAECPALAPLVKPLLAHHKTTLHTLATITAGASAQSSEGERFIATLRELLGTGRYLLISTDPAHQAKGMLKDDEAISNPLVNDRIIGRSDSVGVWIVPDLALRAVNSVLPDRLGNISAKTLWGQLADLGYLGKQDTNERSYSWPKRHMGRLVRMLCLDPAKLWPKSDEDAADAEPEPPTHADAEAILNDLGL